MRARSAFKSSASLPPSSPTFENRGEEVNVRELHAAIMRERAEPREGREPTPLWLIALIGGLLFWGGFYLQRYSGDFKPLVFDEQARGPTIGSPAQPPGPVDIMVLGRRTFQNNCQQCHQENGLGLPGQYPPLAASEWVLADSPARLVRIVLDGMTGPVEVRGQLYHNTMVPWREVLSNQQVAAVLSFIRQAWGNRASPVTEADVKAIRELTKIRTGTPWTVPDLMQIPLQLDASTEVKSATR